VREPDSLDPQHLSNKASALEALGLMDQVCVCVCVCGRESVCV